MPDENPKPDDKEEITPLEPVTDESEVAKRELLARTIHALRQKRLNAEAKDAGEDDGVADRVEAPLNVELPAFDDAETDEDATPIPELPPEMLTPPITAPPPANEPEPVAVVSEESSAAVESAPDVQDEAEAEISTAAEQAIDAPIHEEELPPVEAEPELESESSKIVPVEPEQKPPREIASALPVQMESRAEAPWTLQQFFNGEIDLDVELASRFKSMPVMSTIRFRGLGSRTGRAVATLSTQDGAAQVIVDADQSTRVVQMSFTFGSMLTLRFVMNELNDTDRTRWLELMRRQEGGLAFLWGPSRWESDYLICISRKYFTNLYAFSPHNFEAAIRMTPDVADQLLDWLEGFWLDEDDAGDEPPALLTW